MRDEHPFHGSEDYPASQRTDDFQVWANEFEQHQPWTELDTWLRRILVAGGAVALWIAVGILFVILIKGDI